MDELVEAASIHNPKLKTVAFLNKVDTNPKIKLSSEAYNIASTLKSIKLKDIQIGYRVAFRVSVAEGIAVTEIKDKKDKKAIQEIKGLYEEVFRDA
jgi:cellulose biosynthesis protein BcsQ